MATDTLIIDPAKWKLIPLDKLLMADWNYKADDPILEAKLVENMKRNGIIESCIVRLLPTGFYEIVNGNHRYSAALKLNANGLFCYDLGDITVLEAQRIAIETNETRFQTQAVLLSERFRDLSAVFSPDELALTMPYSAEEISNMAKLADFDWSKYDKSAIQATPAPPEGSDVGGAEGYRTIQFVVPESVYEAWKTLVEESKEVLEYDETLYPNVESRIFELAIAEMRSGLPNA